MLLINRFRKINLFILVGIAVILQALISPYFIAPACVEKGALLNLIKSHRQ